MTNEISGRVPGGILALALLLAALAVFIVIVWPGRCLQWNGQDFGKCGDIVAETLPDGVIVTSVKPCSDLTPGDWKQYDKALGRFIVGAGEPLPESAKLDDKYKTFELVEKNGETSKKLLRPFTGLGAGYKVESADGSEYYRLVEKNLPSHRHQLPLGSLSGQANVGKYDDSNATAKIPFLDKGKENVVYSQIEEGVKSTGESEPVNNLPPYIALYFCRKI